MGKAGTEAGTEAGTKAGTGCFSDDVIALFDV